MSDDNNNDNSNNIKAPKPESIVVKEKEKKEAAGKSKHGSVRSFLGSEYQRHLDLNEAKLTFLEAIKSMLTPKVIVGIIVWLIMISAFGYFYFSGLLLEVSKGVEDLGVAGMLIFVVALIIVAQPFAWGFSATVLAIGFIYGWIGFPLVLVGSIIGCSIAFFEVRYLAKDYIQAKIDKMEPRAQLVVKEIEHSATKTVCSSYPVLVGIRLSPLPYGISNSLFAITSLTYARYLITSVISFCITPPITVNLGIVARQLADVSGSQQTNLTEAEKALQAESDRIENISLGISVGVAVVVVVCSIFYGRWVMKKVDKLREEEVLEEIESINEEANEEDNDLGFVRESARLSFRYKAHHHHHHENREKFNDPYIQGII